jgi:signal transduction histidine kinase
VRLSDFIRENHPKIIAEWVAFARTLGASAEAMSKSALQDHADELLDAIVSDMESTQTAQEQTEKSKGRDVENAMRPVGKIHAVVRIESGFKLDQVVAEYRALRASVLRLWEMSRDTDLREVTRFNEAIDEALTEAADRFTEAMDQYRDRFVGILGHDLRNPLGAIIMTAGLISRSKGLDARQTAAIHRIVNSANRMNRMVGDLLDLTRGQLQGGLPIKPAPMDLALLCRQVVAELDSFHPDSRLLFESRGELKGAWDSDRLAQMISNLVGNAVQHGRKGTPVRITAQGEDDHVAIDVHNDGPLIPEPGMATIFEPFVRGPVNEDEKRTNSLGLGLYIAQLIATAHGGTIKVSSTLAEGTTFSVHMPRRIQAVNHLRDHSNPHDSGAEPGASLH